MPTPKTDAVPRSVGHALDLLEVVVDAGEVNLSTAAERVGLTPTTALRHLRALEARGYLRRDADGVFSAGPTVLRLAASAHSGGPLARLVAAAQPVLDELTDRTGESSYLAVTDGDAAVYLATSESQRSIRHVGWVGKTVPIEGTAVGAALSGRPGSHARSGSVEADIAAVARAITAGDPVEAGGDTVVAAISIIGPAHRMDDRAAAVASDALAAAVARLAAELGLPVAVAS